MSKVDNAIIMAAGTSTRFAPLSYEKSKALTMVKGQILIERQIEQLQKAGISEIYVITGYKAEQLQYLKKKYGVSLIDNSEYLSRNNHGSIWAAREILKNSYLCSADNYFIENPFELEVEESYYATVYANGRTEEWCVTEDEEGFIDSVHIGGDNTWYMMGHTFWSQDFSKRFLVILEKEYDREETKGKLWEAIYMEHLDCLKMKARKYPPNYIFEFDSLEELRKFDTSYERDARSEIMRYLAKELAVLESELVNIRAMKGRTEEAIGISFDCRARHYHYYYEKKTLLLSR